MAESMYEIKVNSPNGEKVIKLARPNRQMAAQAAVWIAFEDDNDNQLAELNWGSKSESERFMIALQAGYRI